MVAENRSPGGAGPVRSVNTPTICGRRLGSGKPPRTGLPAGSVNPTKVAKVPARVEVISMRWNIRGHLRLAAWSRGTLAITTLRSVTSTRLLLTTTNNALSAASLPFLGAVLSTTPPSGGRSRTTEHGTVAVTSTGVSEISGAVTLFNWPFCGQFSVAVVCTTGSSGVATDRTKPISPAIVATQRVTRTCRRVSRPRGGRWSFVVDDAHGRARIGPCRLQPRTVITPCSTTAFGA